MLKRNKKTKKLIPYKIVFESSPVSAKDGPNAADIVVITTLITAVVNAINKIT